MNMITGVAIGTAIGTALWIINGEFIWYPIGLSMGMSIYLALGDEEKVTK